MVAVSTSREDLLEYFKVLKQYMTDPKIKKELDPFIGDYLSWRENHEDQWLDYLSKTASQNQ